MFSLLNNAVIKPKAEIIIFAHPDICLSDPNSLNIVDNFSNNINDYGVLGIAGCKGNRERILISNSIHGCKKSKIGKSINKPTRVETVDECSFV